MTESIIEFEQETFINIFFIKFEQNFMEKFKKVNSLSQYVKPKNKFPIPYWPYHSNYHWKVFPNVVSLRTMDCLQVIFFYLHSYYNTQRSTVLFIIWVINLTTMIISMKFSSIWSSYNNRKSIKLSLIIALWCCLLLLKLLIVISSHIK